jgi:hypothetical protein
MNMMESYNTDLSSLEDDEDDGNMQRRHLERK